MIYWYVVLWAMSTVYNSAMFYWPALLLDLTMREFVLTCVRDSRTPWTLLDLISITPLGADTISCTTLPRASAYAWHAVIPSRNAALYRVLLWCVTATPNRRQRPRRFIL